jgi:hypothetical protein
MQILAILLNKETTLLLTCASTGGTMGWCGADSMWRTMDLPGRDFGNHAGRQTHFPNPNKRYRESDQRAVADGCISCTVAHL